MRSCSSLDGSSEGRSAPCCFCVGCWAEDGSAVVGSEELGLVSSVLEVVVVSVTLGLEVRVEVFGSLFAGVEVGSGTQTQIRLY
jgi:hypothetical protein